MIALALALVAVQDPTVQRQVEQWVARLEAEDPAAREEAEEAIRRLGAAAVPHLERIQEFPGPEARARVQDLLRELRQGPTSAYYGPVVYVALDVPAGPAMALASHLSQVTPWKVQSANLVERTLPAVRCAELPFFAAMDAISGQTGRGYRVALGGVLYDRHGGNEESDVQILVAGAHRGPTVYPGPTRISVETITRKRTFTFDGEEETLEVELMILWQPNVLPSRVEHVLEEAVSSAGETLAEPSRGDVGRESGRTGTMARNGPIETVRLRIPSGSASFTLGGRFRVDVPDEDAVLRAPMTLPAEYERGGRTLRLEAPPEEAGEGAVLVLQVLAGEDVSGEPTVRLLDDTGDPIPRLNAYWSWRGPSQGGWRGTLTAHRWDGQPIEIGQVEVLFPDRTRTYEVPYRFENLPVPEYWE